MCFTTSVSLYVFHYICFTVCVDLHLFHCSSVGVDTVCPAHAVIACYDALLLFLAKTRGRCRGKTIQYATADPVAQSSVGIDTGMPSSCSDDIDTGMPSSCSDCLL